MSDSSDSSLNDSDYYDVDISTYYNETEVFTDDELQNDEQEEYFSIQSDIQDACSTTIEDFQCIEPNNEESYEDSPNVMLKIDSDVDSITLKEDLFNFNNYGSILSNRKSVLLTENTTSAYESGEMTDENTTATYDGDGTADVNTTYDDDGMTDVNTTYGSDGMTDVNTTYGSDGMADVNTTYGSDGMADEYTTYDDDGMADEYTTYDDDGMTDKNTTYESDGMTDKNTTYDDGKTDKNTTYESDGMTDKNKLNTSNIDKKTKQKDAYTNMKFTPKTLNKLRRLLVDEMHSSDDQEFYIGDLLNAIESKLMNLPKEKKKVAKKSPGNIVIKPKKPKQKKLKVLSRYAIRSMSLKRDYHMRNMKVLASSLSEQFIELDDMIEYFRQVNAEFDAEFNQPNTSLGEPKLASKRMDDVYMKFKVRIPALQDCYKEVKHCLSLYVKSDKTLKDDLLRNINKYFVNSRVDEVLSVKYEEILEAFSNSNRLHYRF